MTWISARLSAFWLVLVVVSVLSFESSLFGSKAAGAIAIAIGLLKAGVVGSEFMEIRGAPMVLRALFGAWLAVLAAALLGVFYILGA